VSRFIGKLVLEALPDGKTWKLQHPFAYQSDRYKRTVRAAEDFECDFASIPRLFWRAIGPPATGRYRRAAVIHDWMYCNHVQTLTRHAISRAEADGLFYEAMICDGVGWINAWLICKAVRLGGWVSWKE